MASAMMTDPRLPAARGPSQAAATVFDGRRLDRLRWRCRRGMLENDIVLARFLDARGATLAAVDIAALEVLLDRNDNDLWALLSGREEPADAALAPLVACLRSI